MKNKIFILVLSIVIAIIVLCVGIFGIDEISSIDRNKKNNSKNNLSENVLSDKNTDKTTTTDKDSTKDESTTTQEITTQEITTQETTTKIDIDDDSVKYLDSDIDPSKPMVALTFDDGPNNENTPRILDALRKYNGHATFFVVSYNIDGNEDIMRRAVNEGSEIGNHTKSHSKLTSLDSNGISEEVNSTKDRIKQITGEKNVVLRPPYGAVDDNVMSVISDPVILWSIDTLDWKTKDANTTVQNIKSTVFDGSIILMHDIYSQSADAAVEIIDWLNSQGYQLVTISEMGYFRRGGLKTGVRYGSLKPN